VAIGPITDARLRPGDFRELSADEVAALKKNAGQPRRSPPVRVNRKNPDPM
jgi:hypothetical protein